MNRAWLADFKWENIVEINAALCAQKANTDHKPTSDGYAKTKLYWEENHTREMKLDEAVALCFKCHRLSPFVNYNGNTFVAVIRNVITSITELTPEEQTIARSLAGHMVAGTAESYERIQFQELLQQLNAKGSPPPPPPPKKHRRVGE